jgi:hypothetical protein
LTACSLALLLALPHCIPSHFQTKLIFANNLSTDIPPSSSISSSSIHDMTLLTIEMRSQKTVLVVAPCCCCCRPPTNHFRLYVPLITLLAYVFCCLYHSISIFIGIQFYQSSHPVLYLSQPLSPFLADLSHLTVRFDLGRLRSPTNVLVSQLRRIRPYLTDRHV